MRLGSFSSHILCDDLVKLIYVSAVPNILPFSKAAILYECTYIDDHDNSDDLLLLDLLICQIYTVQSVLLIWASMMNILE